MCIYIRYISKLKIIKLFYLLLTILFVLSIIGTSSRGGSLALGAALFYQWIKAKNKLIGLVGVVILIFIVILYAPPQYYERMETITDYETEGSAAGRIAIWKSGIRMVVDHPLIGVGAGHFFVKFGTEYRPPGVGRRPLPWANAHSLYIQVLAELGFPGLVAYLGLIFVNLVRNERIIRSSRNNEDPGSFHTEKHLFVCLNSSLIGFAVGGAFLSVAYYPHIFILAGVMEVARRMYERQQESKGENLVLAVR
jgi:probable O-glycosylation ligase (exosortase A-associated)